MLPVRTSYLHRALHNGKGRPATAVVHALRHLSTRPFRHSSPTQKDSLASYTPRSAWLSSGPRICHARSASTAANAPAIDAPPAGPALSASDEWTRSLESLTSTGLSNIEPHIGYFKELGLDYGWGPTAVVQFLLEHVHVWSGLPFWSSIALTAIGIRLVLLKLFMDAADTNGRLVVIKPHMLPLQDRMKAARAVGDQQAMLAATRELRDLYKNSGVQVWRAFLPMVMQIPLGYGMFRLTQGMAKLPLPGLDQGGFAWVADLTIPDPYFILPVCTSAMMYLTVKKGGELGSAQMANPQIFNLMLYGLPAISMLFMSFMPGATQVVFATTSLLSYFQNRLIHHPTTRRIFGIQPLPPKDRPSAPNTTGYSGVMTQYQAPSATAVAEAPEKESVVAGAKTFLKGKYESMKQVAREGDKGAGRLTKAELRSAKRYEAERKKEVQMEKLAREARDREKRLKR